MSKAKHAGMNSRRKIRINRVNASLYIALLVQKGNERLGVEFPRLFKFGKLPRTLGVGAPGCFIDLSHSGYFITTLAELNLYAFGLPIKAIPIFPYF
jgi:hypothetical protein